jgi:hypothetical protein
MFNSTFFAFVMLATVALFHASVTDAAIPTQMAAPVLKTACSTELTVAWAEASSTTGEAKYKIEIDDGNGGDFATASFETFATLEKKFSSLTAGKSYRTRVTAQNADGDGPVSDIATFATPAAAVPSKPEPPLVVDSCKDSIELEWVPPTSGCATTYEVTVDNGAGDQDPTWDAAKKYDGANLTHKFTGLTADKPYRFQIMAKNGTGDSTKSELLYQRTLKADAVPSKPAAPMLQQFDVKPARTHSDATTGTMTLRWERGNRCGATSKLEMDAGSKNGWNAQRDSKVTYSQVTRTSDTVATISVPAMSDYTMGRDEDFAVNAVPAAAVQGGADISIAAAWKHTEGASTPAAAISGTFVSGMMSSTTLADATEYTLQITLAGGETWHTDVGADNAKTSGLVSGIVSDCSTCGAKGWNSLRDAAITHAKVVRTSSTVVTISVPQMSTYETTKDENLTITIPKASTTSDSADIVVPYKVRIYKSSSTAAAMVQGTFVEAVRTQADIRANAYTITVTLANDKWHASLGTDHASTTALIKSIFEGTWTQIYESTGFEYLKGGLDSSMTYQFRVTHKNDVGYGIASEPLVQHFPKLYILVSDHKNDRVLRFDGTTGDYKDEFIPKGSGGLGKPYGIAVGPGGDVFVSSDSNSAVLRYDGKSGAFKSKFASVAGGPRDLVFAAATNWPANLMPNVGSEIKAKCPALGRGAGSVHWPQYGLKPEECQIGRQARYNVEQKRPYVNSCCLGHMYVSSHFDSAVLKFNGVTGSPLGTFASSIDTPMGLFFDYDGHMRVASEHGDKVVKVNGVTGSIMATTFSDKSLNYASGLDSKVVDGKGKLYVTGPYSGKVTAVYDAKTGKYQEHFQDDLAPYPFGLVQYDGHLYVSNKHTIRRYNADTGELVDTPVSKDGMHATYFTFHYI